MIRDEDRREFQMYSSKLESRLQAMQTDLTTRIINLYDMGKEERAELLEEVRDIRRNIGHIEHCPYVEDMKRRRQA